MKKIIVMLMMFVVTNVYALDLKRRMGDANAPVVLQEFSSMTCPHCAVFHKNVYPELVKKYVDTGKVRIEFNSFPLDNVALVTSMLGISLPRASFFKFIEHAFFYQKDLHNTPKKTLLKWSKMAGLTEKDFNAIVSDSNLANAIQADYVKSQKKYNITGTPTIVINEEVITKVDKKTIFAEIEKALKK